MIYLYAYTNFKDGLDSLRRVAALYWELQKEQIECELLVNDYRAQLLARSWGLPLATTIETIKDIDAVATPEDIVVIDSPESIEGKVLGYGEYFKKVIYLKNTPQSLPNAETIDIFDPEWLLFSEVAREVSQNAIFIYGDSDYEKTIIKNLDKFKNKGLDLYWGNYFFVKYEDTMLEVFRKIVESEEYYDALKEYEYVITSDIQIAIESAGNGIKTLFLELLELSKEQKDILDTLQIKRVNGLDSFDFAKISVNKNLQNSSKKIINIIKNYV